MKTLREQEFDSFREREIQNRVSLSDEQEQDDYVDEGVSAVWMERPDNKMMENVFLDITAVCKIR